MFQEINRKDIPTNSVVLPSRFVNDIKNIGTLEELSKVRYTAGGNLDYIKILLIHVAVNVRHWPVRIVSSMAVNKKWKVWAKDGDQVYIQGKDLTRFFVFIPPPECKLHTDIVLKVCKYLYDLSEAGDVWYHKLRCDINEKLKMKFLAGDQAMSSSREPPDKPMAVENHKWEETARELQGPCEGLLGTYVDDLIFTGTS